MIPSFYRQTAEVEDRHWWFDHRRALVGALLDRHARGEHATGLDLGCGTGGSTRVLAERCGFVIGVDRSEVALGLARSKGAPARLVRADANRIADTVAAGTIDLVSVLNVLYHSWVRDEAPVLAGVRRILRTGGHLVLTEPAFALLRRRHDVVDFGTRRFRRSRLRQLVTEAGFEVRFVSCFNVVSLAPALAIAAFDRVAGRTRTDVIADESVGEIRRPPVPLDSVLRLACRIERAALTLGLRLPLGVGIVVVARAVEACPPERSQPR